MRLPNVSFVLSENKVGPLPTTKEMRDAQANHVLCQNLKEVLIKDEM